MNSQEPPRGGRMLEKSKDVTDAVERKPAPSENAISTAEQAPEATPRRTPRKRRKRFVL